MRRGSHRCLLPAAFTLIAGCAATGVGEDVGRVNLPTGATLLESEDESCEGIIELSAGVRGQDRARVAPGQNAVFRLDDDEEVVWACLDERAPDSERLECPADSEYVRVTRAVAGEDVLFECFS